MSELWSVGRPFTVGAVFVLGYAVLLSCWSHLVTTHSFTHSLTQVWVVIVADDIFSEALSSSLLCWTDSALH